MSNPKIPGQVLTAKHKGLIVWVAHCTRKRTLSSQQQLHTEQCVSSLRKLMGKGRAILLLKWLCGS